MRLLILACSGRKRSKPNPLPALLRYDGVAYRTLWRYLAPRTFAPKLMLPWGSTFQRAQIAAVQELSNLDVLILSAEFGLIPATLPIPTYDRRMTRQHDQELRADASTFLREWLWSHRYQHTLVMLGADYREVLDLDLQRAPAPLGAITTTASGIGV